MSSTAKRALVAPRDAALGELFDLLGPDAGLALVEGRLFVGRKRALAETEAVKAGELLEIHAPRPPVGGAFVLAERDDLVAAWKPAGMPTIPDHRGANGSLLGLMETTTGLRLHATSRLDLGVSGVVLFAATEAAASRLSRAREEGTYRRRYVAIAAKAPEPERGIWTFPIGRAPNPRQRRAFGSNATRAETHYRVVDRASSGAALLAVEPQTGRTHQIRVHASHVGSPLLGDTMYGGPARLVSATGAVMRLPRIALHAAWVEVPDASGKAARFEAKIPEDLAVIWRAADGAEDALPSAIAGG